MNKKQYNRPIAEELLCAADSLLAGSPLNEGETDTGGGLHDGEVNTGLSRRHQPQQVWDTEEDSEDFFF